MNSEVKQKQPKKKVSRLSTATQQELSGDVIDNLTGVDTRIAAILSYGTERARYAKNFKTWVGETRTTKQQFEHLLQIALGGGSNNPRIEYLDGLELVIDGISIWFDSDHFKEYVGDQKVFGADLSDLGDWIDGADYLEQHWEGHAHEFIMNNLHRAEIDNSELEKL